MNIKKFLVILLILAGGWYAFYGRDMLPAPMGHGDANLKAIKKVKSQEALQLIQAGSGRIRLVHIFKTTCVLCRVYFGDIVDTARNYPGAKMLVIATDRYPPLLAEFLAGRDLPFTPLLLDDSPESLAAALKPADVHYDGDEPYTAIIDGGGQVTEFAVGSRFAARLGNYLEEKK